MYAQRYNNDAIELYKEYYEAKEWITNRKIGEGSGDDGRINT